MITDLSEDEDKSKYKAFWNMMARTYNCMHASNRLIPVMVVVLHRESGRLVEPVRGRGVRRSINVE
jgi:hypothetical protein